MVIFFLGKILLTVVYEIRYYIYVIDFVTYIGAWRKNNPVFQSVKCVERYDKYNSIFSTLSNYLY